MLWLAGCSSVSKVVVAEPVGPGPMVGSHGSGNGSLMIYSARAPADVDVYTEEWRWNNDFGRNAFLYQAAHSDYTVYTQDGVVFKRVSNGRDSADDAPTVVSLPAGTYRVEAEAVDCSSERVEVMFPVVVEPGQATVANLEGGWIASGAHGQTELARLPCGRAIGWRASEAGFAGVQPDR
jgi:hypothetical protein